MSQTRVEIVVDDDRLGQVREFVKSINGTILTEKPHHGLQRLGKLQALSILEKKEELILPNYKGVLAVRIKDKSVLFCRFSVSTGKYECGSVPKSFFWQQVKLTSKPSLSSAVDSSLIRPHLIDTGTFSRAPKFDEAIQLLSLDEAQAWIGLKWD